MTESNIAVIDETAPVVETTETAVVETVPEPTPVVEFPHANDDRVSLADAMTRFAELYTFGTEHPEFRDALDARAYKQFVRALTAKTEDTDVVADTFELPRYGDSGLDPFGEPIGSLRYTKQRATILAFVAEANSVAPQLMFFRYLYPGITKRKAHYVALHGTRSDIDRTLLVYRLMAKRAMTDAYAGEGNAPLGTTFTQEQKNMPAQQTRARRAWMINVANALGAALQAVTDTVNTRQAVILSDRSTAAHAAMDEFLKENAEANQDRSDDRKVETDSVDE